jgi:hypothetical protein
MELTVKSEMHLPEWTLEGIDTYDIMYKRGSW